MGRLKLIARSPVPTHHGAAELNPLLPHLAIDEEIAAPRARVVEGSDQYGVFARLGRGKADQRGGVIPGPVVVHRNLATCL